jgi:hypothetical protein
MTGCLVAVVPAACRPFTVQFFRELRELDLLEEELNALQEYERRYGSDRGIDILRADLKDRHGFLEQRLKDRIGGITVCARRELGDEEVERIISG